MKQIKVSQYMIEHEGEDISSISTSDGSYLKDDACMWALAQEIIKMRALLQAVHTFSNPELMHAHLNIAEYLNNLPR